MPEPRQKRPALPVPESPPGSPAPCLPAPGTSSFWRVRLRATFPFVLTSLITVFLTLLVQTVIPRPDRWEQPGCPRDEGFSTAHILRLCLCSWPHSARASAGPSWSAGAAPAPAPVVAPIREQPAFLRVASLLPAETSNTPVTEAAMVVAVLDLRAELRRLWSAYYLVRAALQLADAEASLRVNDLEETERVLVTVGISLDLAYEQSSEQDKGPISEFRMQVGNLREDLYIRPEDMDYRLRRLRQSMLSLVDENRSYR
ncbi:MAG: hypothetical protein HC884_04255 [Chloroflexaceae bacterium]|nr:hypothetical protein [Chloroflexaceae bacterium]